LHPTREIAYLGTGSGGDRMFTIDITDKSKPVVTDSIVENTRRVNDIMTNPAGTHLVFTREGASDRKNGIVIATLDDPLHPKKCADYTEGLTGGVHSTFVYRQEKYGTHIYLTNDGTGAIHIIDWNDPCQPKTAAVWKTPRPDAGRSLHDIDVQDGLAYLSYWNDGLVILDIGNGVKGGSPSNPQLVSQYKYDRTTCTGRWRRRVARASFAARTPPGVTRTTCSLPTRCSPPRRSRVPRMRAPGARTAACR
jgi:hypothetical protein